MMMTTQRQFRIIAGAAALLCVVLFALSSMHVYAVGQVLRSDDGGTGLQRTLANPGTLVAGCLVGVGAFLIFAYEIAGSAGLTGARSTSGNADPTADMLWDVMDHTSDVVSIKDPHGRYVRVNQRFTELFGTDGRSMAGLSDADLFSKVVADPIRANDRRALQGAESLEVEEILPYGGAPHTFRSRKCPVYDDDGNPRALYTISSEITANDIAAPEGEAEEQDGEVMDMYQAQKLEAVGTLAGGLAHDFNNVLTAVLGGLEMALRGVPVEEEKLRKRLLRVEKAARRAADLTRQLLTLSRPTQAIMGMTDLNTVINATTQLLARSIPDNIEVRTWLDDELPVVLADAGQVEQALLNLGVNARDAMPQGGRITYETKMVTVDANTAGQNADAGEGKYVRITVSDNGTGIPRQVLERMFEPFYTTKEVGKGTGLGLAMVRSCLKAHEGWLGVDSVVGRGTTFALYIPVTEAVVEAARPGDDAGDGVDPLTAYGGTETILVVDDEADVLDLATTGLAEYGYQVITAGDGEHAIAVLTQHQQDVRLIVTDLVMPKCGGDKLRQILRKRGYTLPVILMSGYVPPSSDDVFQNPDQDFTAILHKPFTPRDLARIIRHTLDTGAPSPTTTP